MFFTQYLKRLLSNSPARNKDEGFTYDCKVEYVLDEEWLGGVSGVIGMKIAGVYCGREQG